VGIKFLFTLSNISDLCLVEIVVQRKDSAIFSKAAVKIHSREWEVWFQILLDRKGN